MLLNSKKAIAVVVLISISVSSCSYFKLKKQPQPSLTLEIIASKHINSLDIGQGDPLQARIYELSNIALFNKSDFLGLYLNDANALQKSLITKHLLPVILPSEHKILQLKLKAETRFIAVLAEFANYRTSVSTTYLALEPSKHHSLALFVEDNHVRLVRKPLAK